MTSSRPGWTRPALLAAIALASAASLGAPAAMASASPEAEAVAQARATVIAERAATYRAVTTQLLEGRRRHLARCLQRHPERCARWKTAVERSEQRLALAETRVAATHSAPQVTVSGETLSWAPVAGAEAYVLKRRSPTLRGSRSIVYGTSVVPPAIPGETVEYEVKTAAAGSEWSTAVTITYPATTPPPAEAGAGAGSGSGSGGGSGSGLGSLPAAP